jgi:cytochrome c oxidase assembly protein subunit 15
MEKSKSIFLTARIALILIFLVILAGSVVRMSGSGMGCPDWPKCFGHYIPPTHVEELTYTEGKFFKKGMMVLLENRFWVAKEDISASGNFQSEKWEMYDVHDYSIYNPVHTWIEYINRLIGALSGIPTLILFVLSFIGLLRRRDLITFILSALTLFMLGFEAWLGKTVVDSGLHEGQITLHMFGSVVIVALLLMIIYRHRQNKVEVSNYSNYWKVMSAVVMVIAFSQVLLGTQVREAVDVISEVNKDRSTWIDALPGIFKVHRSFSILVAVLVGWMFFRSRSLVKIPFALKGIFAITVAEIVLGIILAYGALPAPAQPLHLVLAILWFACAWYFRQQVWSKVKFIS